MEEQRACAHCGERLQVNPRARAAHRFCARAECQRERRRVRQRARRAERGGAPPPSEASKRRRAAYMRAYRARRPGYRLRERLARARRRGVQGKRAGFTRAVTEAGLAGMPAKLYVVSGPRGRIRLRVVTPNGAAVIIEPAVDWGHSARAVTEAGFEP